MVEKTIFDVIFDPILVRDAIIAAVLAGIVFAIIVIPFAKKTETPEEKLRERNAMAGALVALVFMAVSAAYFFWRLSYLY